MNGFIKQWGVYDKASLSIDIQATFLFSVAFKNVPKVIITTGRNNNNPSSRNAYITYYTKTTEMLKCGSYGDNMQFIDWQAEGY